MKKFVVLCLSVLLGLAALSPSMAAEVPTVRVSYIFTTHHEPFMVAMSKCEGLKDQGIWLEQVVPKEKYDLFVDGEKVARLNVVVAKSGSETAVLFAQKHIDLGMGSLPAMMTARDKGTPVKVLCPLHADGIGLVVPSNSPYGSWDEFLDALRNSDKPIKVGYHSPTSAPRIIFESAMFDNDISVTQKMGEDADVFLVDLKSTSNLIPALTSGQVDAWVGPDPFPEMAAFRGAGKVLMDLRDLPPAGKWSNFPCCVVAAREETIASDGPVVKAFVDLMTKTCSWCNDNKEEAATLGAGWIGIPAEAAKKSTIVYTTDPSENWITGAGVFMTYLDKMGKFKGSFAGKRLEDVQEGLFDFSFVR
ncbi:MULTISPECIES: ABC transporter substrate-binding protein [Dethiosulfovibrio]|uniref:ABC transporter substrate-binding protein n=2 Tax=Dethiosulfovibrio TaxID=47054 RepID=A0ABS9EQD8_9BACT|nr:MULTISPECIES: ABC transporter substrate-binding protein [Dethiosulfovibrio]MCF4113288.1 ABC transporter substrate-binding protein [Dethiosulfovibrio russensis]MCF4142352.1 ABC transporter substrate-binding protein [Dethiosulfovibrio marinus]MCF4145636.1 ABC transporter substrate-binding protein [Dethiosulfovibrio acidaminovorans]